MVWLWWCRMGLVVVRVVIIKRRCGDICGGGIVAVVVVE